MDWESTEAGEATRVLDKHDAKQLRAHALIGKKFHRLTVLGIVDDGRPIGDANMLCKCECGAKTSVYIKNLKANGTGTKSCGCSRTDFNKAKKIDLTGRRFGKLVVLHEIAERRQGRIFWKCQCDCGHVVDVRGAQLTADRPGRQTRSCGCLAMEANYKKRKTYVGRRFGRLVVTERVPGGSKGFRFKCDCDCGRTCVVRGSGLNKTRSCGCLRDEIDRKKTWRRDRDYYKLPDNRGLWNIILKSTTEGAARRGLEWSISLEQAIELMKLPCSYCGARYSKHKSGAKVTILANGIDRVDSSLGYIDGNVVPCCKTCNLAKSNKKKEEFLAWIFRVAQYNGMQMPA